jgi:hypothetical protein
MLWELDVMLTETEGGGVGGGVVGGVVVGGDADDPHPLSARINSRVADNCTIIEEIGACLFMDSSLPGGTLMEYKDQSNSSIFFPESPQIKPINPYPF